MTNPLLSDGCTRSMPYAWVAIVVCAASMILAAGCSSDTAAGGGSMTAEGGGRIGPGSVGTPGQGGTTGGTGVTQAGAQDFGQFRKILEDGKVPGPSTLDAMGFFAEHKLDYPSADCGGKLCLHGLLGVMGNMITGANCTLVQLGMNTPIDVSKLERPPMHLVVAVATSMSMDGPSMDWVRDGLVAMLGGLSDEDHVSLVRYSTGAKTVFEHQAMSAKADMSKAFKALQPGSLTNLFGGLFRAYAVARKHNAKGVHSRVLLLSDGVASKGITDTAKLKSLAIAHALEGIGLSTIGVGTSFDVVTMRQLAEVGAGSFYFVEDAKAAEEVFTEEVKTMMFPVALDVHIDIFIGDGYLLRGAYGTKGFTATATGGTIHIPSLFLARRQDSSAPIDDGRRGGGGAIMLELIPLEGAGGNQELLKVALLKMRYTDPESGAVKKVNKTVNSTLMPGKLPASGAFFTNKTVEKGFVMLNVFTGFQMATDLAKDADPGAAIGVLKAMKPPLSAWLVKYPDPDIADDAKYIDMYIDVLEKQPNQTQVAPPPEPWPYD